MKFAFYKGRTRFFDRFAAYWTRGPYSHCEAVLADLPDGLQLCASASLLDGGVRYKAMALNPDHWDMLEVPDSRVAPDQVKAWFDQHQGRGYDLIGLFLFAVPARHDDSRWFCSEAVADACGIQDAWRFDPNRLYILLSQIGRPTPVQPPDPSPMRPAGQT